MNIVDRLVRRTPDSELPPVEPLSFDDMLATAHLRGVKGFIAVEPPNYYGPAREEEIESTLKYHFVTKSGRRVEFSESYGVHPDNRQTQLKGFLTAMNRSREISDKTGLSSDVTFGYSAIGEDPLSPHRVRPMEQFAVLQNATDLGITEGFVLPVDKAV